MPANSLEQEKDREMREAIGFDFGHGETAVARAMCGTRAQPEMLEIHGRKTQITALAVHPEKGVLIGEQALTSPNVAHLQVAFKNKPQEDPEFREIIRKYFESYYRILLDTQQITGGAESRFLVGCPSGWSPEERSRYEVLLRESKIPDISVVPESRAALMHATESGKFTIEELRLPILIIDIGSLTTDLTHLRDRKVTPKNFGNNSLGASLIDKAILRRTLQETNDPELDSILERFPILQTRCELRCRKMKETYFSNELLYEEPESRVEGFERIVTGDHPGSSTILEPVVNAKVISEILDTPMKEFDGTSWTGAYRDLLKSTRTMLEASEDLPRVILMTGGASRMRVTRTICKEIFHESDVRPDSEPEFCIARGLSRLCRGESTAAQFRERVTAFCESGEIEDIAKRRSPELTTLLGAALAPAIVDAAMRPSMLEWQNGGIRTLSELEDRIRDLTKEWLTTGGGTEVASSAWTKWLRVIESDLATPIGRLCQESDIPAGALALNLDLTHDISGLPTQDMTMVDASEELAMIPQMIVAIVIASVLGGTGIALLSSGPIGWIMGLAIGIAVVWGGADATNETIKKIDIPEFFRGWILSDEKINSKCDEVSSELAELLSQKLAEDENLSQDLSKQISAQVQAELQARVEDAVIMIA